MPEYDDKLARLVAELNRAAAPALAQETERVAVSDGSAFDRLLALAVRNEASDLIVVAGAPPTLRSTGGLGSLQGAPLSGDDAREMLLPLLEPRQYEELQKNRSLDFCFLREGLGRFRANIHYQRGTLAGCFRVLPAKIPSLDSLNLPPILQKLAERRQGLVLVTGATGCGKSTTLAALIDLINNKRRDHIVTIEDPVEYVHSNRQSIVEQIEIGHDAPSFAGALRSILRQSPDVILVGEMRDPETMSTALTAAETGHLVFSTLHTNDASQSISRILDSFPMANQPQIRQQLSLALAAVIAQQLVPAADNTRRHPACEILLATDGVRALIRKGDDHQLRSAMSVGRNDGMTTMEQSLADLVRRAKITRETAFAHCFRADDLRRYLEG
ncbi:MAG: type IV pilus twitching motility protein PilT [Bryobacteraceae bacterium]